MKGRVVGKFTEEDYNLSNFLLGQAIGVGFLWGALHVPFGPTVRYFLRVEHVSGSIESIEVSVVRFNSVNVGDEVNS